MVVAELARRGGRDLWHAVAWGPDEPAPWLQRVRGPLLWAVVVVSGLAICALPSFVGVGRLDRFGFWWLVVMALSTGVLALAVFRPLLAWRLAWLALLYELVVAPWSAGRLPFPPLFVSTLQVLLLLAVLFVVGASHRRGVAFWVWLLTALLAWAVPISGSLDFRTTVGDTLLSVGLSEWVDWNDPRAQVFQVIGTVGAIPTQLLTVGLVAAAVLAGQLTRYRSRTRRQLVVAEEHGLVLAERARIARELHDVIAHHMSMIAVRAETAPYRLRAIPDAAREEFQEISHESRTALTEMRRLLGVLRSDEPAPPTTPQPGLTDLGDLVEAARAAGATVTLEMHGSMAGLPAAADVSGYRIVQEALTNAARHAPGASIRIALRRTDAELSLSVRNGPGRPGPRGAAGHGVRGMRERAAALGGELRAGPTEDGGFEVSATLPLSGTEAAAP